VTVGQNLIVGSEAKNVMELIGKISAGIDWQISLIFCLKEVHTAEFVDEL
jgi:hypothetical protein